MTNPNDILKPSDVARILTVSKSQVFNIINSGALNHIRLSEARYGIYRSDLDSYLAARYTNASSPVISTAATEISNVGGIHV